MEGSEYRVLGGMMKTLGAAASKPPILCEIGWGKSHPHWTEELVAFQALGSLGYEPFDLAGRPIELETLQQTTDVIFRAV